MNRLKVGAMIFCWALAGLVFTTGVKADGWNKITEMTFSAPFEVPGVGAQVLPAGTYIFKLLDHKSDRHVVQILNKRQNHVYSTILAIPNYRLHPTDKTVMTFRERAAGQPQAIRAWFYPGNQWGQEFVYPKKRAIELAKLVNEPVLAMPEELAPILAEPMESAQETTVAALQEAPIEAVKPTGEVVAMSEFVEPPPAELAEPSPVEIAEATPKSLPKTASSMPLLALIGLLSITAGLGLSGISKRLF
jgi:hypothetical protein